MLKGGHASIQVDPGDVFLAVMWIVGLKLITNGIGPRTGRDVGGKVKDDVRLYKGYRCLLAYSILLCMIIL